MPTAPQPPRLSLPSLPSAPAQQGSNPFFALAQLVDKQAARKEASLVSTARDVQAANSLNRYFASVREQQINDRIAVDNATAISNVFSAAEKSTGVSEYGDVAMSLSAANRFNREVLGTNDLQAGRAANATTKHSARQNNPALDTLASGLESSTKRPFINLAGAMGSDTPVMESLASLGPLLRGEGNQHIRDWLVKHSSKQGLMHLAASPEFAEDLFYDADTNTLFGPLGRTHIISQQNRIADLRAQSLALPESERAAFIANGLAQITNDIRAEAQASENRNFINDQVMNFTGFQVGSDPKVLANAKAAMPGLSKIPSLINSLVKDETSTLEQFSGATEDYSQRLGRLLIGLGDFADVGLEAIQAASEQGDNPGSNQMLSNSQLNDILQPIRNVSSQTTALSSKGVSHSRLATFVRDGVRNGKIKALEAENFILAASSLSVPEASSLNKTILQSGDEEGFYTLLSSPEGGLTSVDVISLAKASAMYDQLGITAVSPSGSTKEGSGATLQDQIRDTIAIGRSLEGVAAVIGDPGLVQRAINISRGAPISLEGLSPEELALAERGIDEIKNLSPSHKAAFVQSMIGQLEGLKDRTAADVSAAMRNWHQSDSQAATIFRTSRDMASDREVSRILNSAPSPVTSSPDTTTAVSLRSSEDEFAGGGLEGLQQGEAPTDPGLQRIAEDLKKLEVESPGLAVNYRRTQSTKGADLDKVLTARSQLAYFRQPQNLLPFSERLGNLSPESRSAVIASWVKSQRITQEAGTAILSSLAVEDAEIRELEDNARIHKALASGQAIIPTTTRTASGIQRSEIRVEGGLVSEFVFDEFGRAVKNPEFGDQALDSTLKEVGESLLVGYQKFAGRSSEGNPARLSNAVGPEGKSLFNYVDQVTLNARQQIEASNSLVAPDPRRVPPENLEDARERFPEIFNSLAPKFRGLKDSISNYQISLRVMKELGFEEKEVNQVGFLRTSLFLAADPLRGASWAKMNAHLLEQTQRQIPGSSFIPGPGGGGTQLDSLKRAVFNETDELRKEAVAELQREELLKAIQLVHNSQFVEGKGKASEVVNKIVANARSSE